jgi:hypothetical protein
MKLSETIQRLLAEYDDRPFPLGMLVARTGEQGFGLISGLLTLPLIIPVPIPLAGLSTVLGLGVILSGLQLASGQHEPFLPPFIAKFELSPAFSQTVLKNLGRLLNPVERLARTRLLNVSYNGSLRRFAGLCMAWCAVLMALPLPIPFTNLIPAYTILFFSIGLLELDGLLFLLGFGMTALTTVFFFSIGGLIWNLMLQAIDLISSYL